MKRLKLAGMVIGLLLYSAALVWAQTATVTGKVTDRTKRPVAKATVSIGEKFTFTDSNGRYRVRDVPFGRHMLQLKKGGKVLTEVTIEINTVQKVMNVQLP